MAQQLPLTCVPMLLLRGPEHATREVWLVCQKECNAFVFNGAGTLDPSNLEDGGTVIVQNVRNYLPVHTAEHNRTQASLIYLYSAVSHDSETWCVER